jgi:hypothetical protein
MKIFPERVVAEINIKLITISRLLLLFILIVSNKEFEVL